MSIQSIGKITVQAKSPITNSNITSGVSVKVNTSNDKRVQSILYSTTAVTNALTLSNLSDLEFSGQLNENQVITYSPNTHVFTVQTLPELDGGFF